MPLFTLLSVQVCPPFFQPLCAERDARERIPQTEKGGIANAGRKRNGLPSPNALRPPSLSSEAITPLEDKDECHLGFYSLPSLSLFVWLFLKGVCCWASRRYFSMASRRAYHLRPRFTASTRL